MHEGGTFTIAMYILCQYNRGMRAHLFLNRDICRNLQVISCTVLQAAPALQLSLARTRRIDPHSTNNLITVTT